MEGEQLHMFILSLTESFNQMVKNTFDMFGFILPIGVLVIGGAVIIGLVKRFSSGRKTETAKPKIETATNTTGTSVVTPNEMTLYKVLNKYASDNQYTVLVKPRVADTLQAHLEQNNAFRVLFERIKALHTDFVLCDGSLNPIIGIELDDKSHNRADRQKRDALVNEAFDAAHIPLLHLTDWNENTLATQVKECIERKHVSFNVKPLQPDILKGVYWNFKIYGKAGSYCIYNQRENKDKNKIPLTDEQAAEIALYVAKIRNKSNQEIGV